MSANESNSKQQGKGRKRAAAAGGEPKPADEAATAPAADARPFLPPSASAASTRVQRVNMKAADSSEEKASMDLDESSADETRSAAAAGSSSARPFAASSSGSAAAAAPTSSDTNSSRQLKITQEIDEGEMSEGEEAEERPPPTKRARGSAQPAAVATSVALPSGVPVSKLDPDSLSIAFSFLNTRDFLSSIRVSRQWRAARVKRSAWPQLHLPTLIRALQDDDYDNPARRRLTIDKSSKFAKLLSQPACLQMWRHVPDVRLVGGEQRLQRLLDFPCMAALTLVDSIPSLKVTKALYAGVAERLQALGLARCSEPLYSQLPRFTQLRILVLDRLPGAAALVQLTQLEYLHMEAQDTSYTRRVSMCAVRWLSVHHRLRSLSLGSSRNVNLFASFLLEELVQINPLKSAATLKAWVSLAVQPPLDLSVACGLTDLSLDSYLLFRPVFDWHPDAFCRGLPHLTRLQWTEMINADLATVGWTTLLSGADLQSSVREFLQHLQEARVHCDAWNRGPFDAAMPLRHLRTCGQLRVLRFAARPHLQLAGQATVTPLTTGLLRELLAAWATTIEEIHFEEIRVDFGQDEGDWTALAACRQLRAFTLQPLYKLPSEFLAALSTLPRFRSLGLSWQGQLPPSMPTLLRCIVESRSWSELHFRIHSFFPDEDLILMRQAGGLSEQLAALQMDERTAQRIRVHVYQDTKKEEVKASRFHISSVEEATGKREWQQE